MAQFLPPTFIKNGEYYFAGKSDYTISEWKCTFHIVKFPGLNKKKFHSIGPISIINKKSKKREMGAIPEFYFFYKNEKIYFINMADYQISLFNMDGQIQKSLRGDVDQKKVPEDMKMTWLKEQGGSEKIYDLTDTIQPASWMIPLGKGFIVLLRPGYSTDCNGMVEANGFLKFLIPAVLLF